MSKYPSQIDTDADLPGIIDGSTELSAEAIEAQRLALLAVERTLGPDPQGSQSTLADRLDESLNSDGTIKSAALTAAGLVALPVVNSDIGPAAAIEESKLALDVSTQDLQDQVTSNDVDIYALQGAYTILGGSYASHVAGTANKHSAVAVIVSPSVSGGGTVQSALSGLETEIADHVADTTGAHAASAISYTAPVGTDVVVADVAEALDSIISGSVSATREHSQAAHTNGVSADGYVNPQLAGPGGVLATTLYTPLGGTRIVKIGSPGRPQIRTSGIAPALLSASVADIDIEYTDGYSTQTLTIGAIYSSAYPAGIENRLRGIVGVFNTQLAAARAPVFAYEDRGEIVFQHALADGEFRFSSPVNSAASALGLTDVLGLWAVASTNTVVTNGVARGDYPSTQTGTATLVSPSASITVASGTVAGSLVYITDHPTSSGVYQVTAIVGTTATLNASLDAGPYSYVIQSDFIGIGGTSAGRTYDILVNEDLEASKTLRSEITTAQISGVVTSSCELAAGTYSLALTASSGLRTLVLSDGADVGPTANFYEGFLGQVTVIGPGITGHIVVDVRTASIGAPATDQFTVYAPDGPELHRIGAFWTTGSSTEYAFDHRQFGLVGLNAVTEQEAHRISEKSSGIMFGCEISSTSTAVTIGGGTAMCSGKTRTVVGATFDFSALTGTYTVWIDSDGILRLTAYTEPNSLLNIMQRKDIPIAYVVASSGVTYAYDCALFSGNRAEQELTISSTSLADCRDLAGGLLLASEALMGHVVILTAETATNPVSITNLTVEAYGSLTFDTLDLFATRLVCSADLTATTLTISAASKVSSSTAIYVDDFTIDSSSLEYVDLEIYSSLVLTGSSPTFRGLPNGSASITGSIEITESSLALVTNSDLGFTASSDPYFLFSGTNESPRLSQVRATSSSISAANAASTALYAGISNTGTLSDLTGDQLDFYDRSSFFMNAALATATNTTIDSLILRHSGGLVRNLSTGVMSGFIVSNVLASEQAGTFVALPGAASGVVVDGLEVTGHMSTATFKLLNASVASDRVTFRDIYLHDITTTGDLLTATTTEVIIDNGVFDTVASGYLFAPTTSQFRINGLTGIALNSKLLNGEALHLNDCDLTFSTVSGAPVAVVSTWSKYRITMTNSDITMPVSTALTLREFLLRDSRISVGSFVFVSPSTGTTGYAIEDCQLIATNTGATIGFEFSGLSTASTGEVPVEASVNGCVFTGSPVSYLVSISSGGATNGAWTFHDNRLVMQTPASGEAIMQIGTAETSITNIYSIKNNTLFVGSGSINKAFHIIDHGALIEGNIIRATNITGTIFGSNASGSQAYVRAIRNIIVGTLVADTSDLNLSANRVADNIGAENTYAFTCFGAEQVSGTWTVSVGNELQNTAAGAILVPLILPTGQFTSCTLELYAAGSAGTVSCRVYYQNAIGSIIAASSAATNASGAATQSITISLSSVIVNETKPMFLRIETTTTGNIFGSIKAVMKL